MTSEIVTVTPTHKDIDWSKPQLVACEKVIVLTDGKHVHDVFSGTMVHTDGDKSTLYKYYNDWTKSQFTLCPPDTEIRLRNSK